MYIVITCNVYIHIHCIYIYIYIYILNIRMQVHLILYNVYMLKLLKTETALHIYASQFE